MYLATLALTFNFLKTNLITSQALDIASTKYSISNGCSEKNVLYNSTNPSMVRLVITKSLFTTSAILISEQFIKHGHKSVAKKILVFSSGINYSTSMHNFVVKCN